MGYNYKLKDLINDSVRPYPGMTLIFPNDGREKTIEEYGARYLLHGYAEDYDGCYGFKRGILIFVTDKTVYLTPATGRAYVALEEAGLTEMHFPCIPLSWGEHPKNEQLHWEKLRLLQKDVLVQECLQYCDEHNIGTLDDDILSKCFVIPTTGIKVEYSTGVGKVEYPLFFGKYGCCYGRLKEDTVLGRWCRNNGVLVFVYRDSSTMVTKEDSSIIDALSSAGYKLGPFYVPLSNGEQIVDPVLKSQWEAVLKK